MPKQLIQLQARAKHLVRKKKAGYGVWQKSKTCFIVVCV